MFDWLFEGRLEIYCLFAVLGVIFLLVWWRTRKPAPLIALASVVALAGIYFLFSFARDTPHKQIERNLNEMAAAVKTKDTDAIFKHIAADFHFRSMDRAAFRNLVDAQGRTIDELVIVDDFKWLPGATATTIPVEFTAKPKGGVLAGAEYPVIVRAKFEREADGEWRLQSFELYNLIQNKEPITIPNLP